MRELGLMALAHANFHAVCCSFENHMWSEFSVLQAAHAAELLLKARIAQEHPLLIFQELPRSTKVSGTFIELEDLFIEGKTIQWSDLPERLWATTGILLPNKSKFIEFGKLRNGIQHFAPPQSNSDIGGSTLSFVFDVIDPFINDCWGLYAIDYNEDSEPYAYFANALASREILFLVSKEAAEDSNNWDIDWAKVTKGYKDEMIKRIEMAPDVK